VVLDIADAPVRQRRIAPGAALAVASFGAFLAFLDATIVNIAFPDIQHSFPRTSLAELSWVLNAYNVVFAALLVAAGRFADLFGRRRMFVAGVVVFAIASVGCAIAPSVGFLVAMRVVQAVGGATLVPASLASVIAAYPVERRAHAVGLWGATGALAAGLGPPLGGALVEASNWRLVFWINVPLAVIAIALAGRTMVESRAPGRRSLPDLAGTALLAASLGLVTLALVQADTWGWGSAGVLVALVAGIGCIALFVQRSRTHPVPVLDPRLLRIPTFAVANAVMVLAGIGFSAYLLDNVLWLHYVWGYALLRAGLAVAPAAFVAALAAGSLGRLADRHGFRPIVVTGAVVWAGAYIWYIERVGPHPHFLTQWLPGQVLSGIGVGAVMPLLASASMAAVPGGRYAVASAVSSAARQLGSALGVAFLVIIVGTPTAATAADHLRHGWWLPFGCFLAAGVVSLLLRQPQRVEEVADQPLSEPLLVVNRDEGSAGVGGFTRSTLLSRLDARSQARLQRDAKPIAVQAGEFLMRAGDPADAIYLVQSGRLTVELNGAPFRDLRPGDVVGELGVLAGQPRSADIRARRDSTLLRIGTRQIRGALAAEPKLANAFTVALANELLLSRPPEQRAQTHPGVISVIGATAHAPVDQVAGELVDLMRVHADTVNPGRVDAAGLHRAEQEHQRVVLTAAAGDTAWWRFCLRQADRVVLVATAEDAPRAADPSLADYNLDVVVVGATRTDPAIVGWYDAVDPRRVYAVPDLVPAAQSLGPLARRLVGRSIGLALAGGGARAFAHIGVIEQLKAAGVEIDRVSGCSLGSVVAAIYAAGHDPAEIDAICYEEFVRRNPVNDYTLPTVGLIKGHKTEAAILRAFGDTLLEQLPRELETVSTDLRAHEVVLHRRGRVFDAVRASLSLPVIFPPHRIGDRLLVDGGVLENLPVRPLAESNEGPVVAVDISSGGGSRTGGNGAPRVPGLGETLMRTMLIGGADSLIASRQQAAILVTPDTRGIGLLEFHQIDAAREAGRAAGRAVIEALRTLPSQVEAAEPDRPRPRIPRTRTPQKPSPVGSKAAANGATRKAQSRRVASRRSA
jgi:EmrB/QacA subfamily drug resistance transporter